MLKWFSLTRWENYCLLAMASVSFLIIVTLKTEARSATAPAAPPARALVAAPRLTAPGWSERHKAIVAKAAQNLYDVVLLGDSITQGWEFNAAAWDGAFEGVRALNAGIASDRVEHVLWRVEHGLFAKARPKVVVLLAGVNNLAVTAPTEIAGGLNQVIHAIQKRSPGTQILLLGLFPSGESPTNARRAKIARVNAAIAPLADGRRVRYLDIGNRFLESDGTLTKATSFDSLHFTHRGYGIWARALEKPLKRMLGVEVASQQER
jgi:lysophospholipase L1-like esterase